MTIKQFVKSKTFKCILVLLCIALVSGALLSICNDLLAVSDEERVLRTIKSIYGTEVGYTELDVNYKNDVGEIISVYQLEEGNYLIKSKGKDGYQQGTVTVWLVAEFENGAFSKVGAVTIAEYEKQTLMSKFTSSVLNQFKGEVVEGEDKNIVVGGATFSAKALNNAVNTAIDYVFEELN